MHGRNVKVSWGYFMGSVNSNQEAQTLSFKSWLPLKPFLKIKIVIFSDCIISDICVVAFHSHLSQNTRFK